MDVVHSDGSGVLAFEIPDRLMIFSAPHTLRAVEGLNKPLAPEKPRGTFSVPLAMHVRQALDEMKS